MSIEELLRRKYWSRAEGRAAVEAWRASGESQDVFCARTGVRRARLRYWAALVDGEGPREVKEIKLAEVRVSHRSQRGISILLAGGREIRVEQGFDEELLARVIAVVERA